jgi:cation transport ATPase
MVAEAQRSRAPIQKLADQVSAWFVPTVIAIAVVTFIAWALAGPEPRMPYAIDVQILVVEGILSSTILTLLVLPSLYCLSHRSRAGTREARDQ